MKFSDMKDIDILDVRNAGSWPLEFKMGLWAVLAIAVLVAGYLLDIHHLMGKLEQAHTYELSLKGDFEMKYSMASNLSTNESQMDLLRHSYSTMLQQLPSDSAIDDLLENISQIASTNGLTIDTFRPGSEERKAFYFELPIKVKVSGGYHQFGHFVSDLSSLPRIVTIHDVHIYRNKDKGGGLIMEMTLRSYRYIDDPGQDS